MVSLLFYCPLCLLSSSVSKLIHLKGVPKKIGQSFYYQFNHYEQSQGPQKTSESLEKIQNFNLQK